MEENQMPNTPQESQGPKNHKGLIIAVIIVIAAIALFTLSSKDKDETKNDTQSQNSEQSVDAEATDVADTDGEAMEATKTFEISGNNFSFEPNAFTVKKGDVVKVIFKNDQGFHDFVIDEFRATTAQIQEGNTDEVTFTASEAGTFEFYCSVGNHRAQGMVGTLTVEE